MSASSASDLAHYEAAYRLARYYAILSPRILMAELHVSRDVAASLLDELERNGALGPTLIKGTGARESRVNVVNDRAGEEPAPDAADDALGRRVIALAAAGGALGLLFVGILSWLSPGDLLVRWFRIDLGSPILAALVRSALPSIGVLPAWLAEMPFRRAEDLAPGWAIRARGWIWSGAWLIAVSIAIVRLLG